MKFNPTYKYSQTKIPRKCEYCNKSIWIRNVEDTYTLNGKNICRECLINYAHGLGMTMRELIENGEENE